jgi:flagellar motor switch protein FliG
MAAPQKAGEKNLTGPQKAAILLMTIGEEHAGKILSMLEDEEIKELSGTMSTLGAVSSDMVERLCVEFAEAMAGAGGVSGSFDSTERLLTRALGKGKVDSIMEEIRGPAGRTTWDKLGNVSEDILAAFLKNEYPQTIALVLSKIKSDHAARVLMTLPEDVSVEVIQRMLSMEAVKKEVLENIEKTLRTEFMTNLAKTQRRDSHEMLAEIFNNLDRNAEGKFMGELEKRNPESAEKVRSLMFTFEDIIKVDGQGIQAILRVADKEKLCIALKGASDAIKQLFFSNMSERAAKILKEDMESRGPVRIKDVDEAQTVIVTLAKDMAAKGEIQINDGDESNQMVY